MASCGFVAHRATLKGLLLTAARNAAFAPHLAFKPEPIADFSDFLPGVCTKGDPAVNASGDGVAVAGMLRGQDSWRQS
jgi:hypothetical protein